MRISQLKKKYPKGFDKFWTKTTVTNMESDVRDEWRRIADFMDKRGIHITIDFDRRYKTFEWAVLENEVRGVHEYGYDCKSRKQAETKAIEKAFEILEGRL